MADTLFMIGWYVVEGSLPAWNRLERSYRRIPEEITEWLIEQEISHSYGMQQTDKAWGHSAATWGGKTIEPRHAFITLKVLIIHDPVAACAFRIRWDAMPVALETISETVMPMRTKMMVKELRSSAFG